MTPPFEDGRAQGLTSENSAQLAASLAPSDAAAAWGMGWRVGGLLFVAILFFTFFVGTGTVRAAWQQIAEFLSLQGKPVPSSANVLSEHETENLDQMTPQNQAELLLSRSINHFRGANAEIEQRVASWRGKVTLHPLLNNLFMTALNSDDLRVRAAAIEIDLAARNL